MDHFQVLTHQDGSSVHIKLVGELDNNATHKVIDVLSRNYSRLLKIFIHTNSIDRISNFDAEKFQSRIREARSSAVKPRPRSTGRPMVLKYPGLAAWRPAVGSVPRSMTLPSTE